MTGATPDKSGQAKVLIDRINAEAGAEIDAILAEAHARATERIAAAHKTERARVSAIVADLRRAEEHDETRASAALETSARQAAQQRDAAALRDGIGKVRDALLALWQDSGQRQIWCDSALAAAQSHLPCDGWAIDLPAKTPAALIKRLEAAAQAHCGTAPEIRKDTGLSAGLRIRGGATTLDATPEALCGDETRIGALLLGALRTLEQEASA